MTDKSASNKAFEDAKLKFREKLSSAAKKKIIPEKQEIAVDSRALDEASAISKGDYDDFEAHKKRAETQTIRESNRDLRVNRKLRWKYAKWVFCYLVWYSLTVLVLLVAAGFKILGFSLPENVLEFLVGSTAAAAIGLVLAVTTGLFGRPK